MRGRERDECRQAGSLLERRRWTAIKVVAAIPVSLSFLA
jgi:hypothetical protein